MSTNWKVSENQFQVYLLQLKKKRKRCGTVNYSQSLANLHVCICQSVHPCISWASLSRIQNCESCPVSEKKDKKLYSLRIWSHLIHWLVHNLVLKLMTGSVSAFRLQMHSKPTQRVRWLKTLSTSGHPMSPKISNTYKRLMSDDHRLLAITWTV